MTKFDLGKQLRERELRLGRIPAELVHAVSNEDIVESFMECSICQIRYITNDAGRKMIDESEDVEEFIERINIAFKWHKNQTCKLNDKKENK
jgi:hypothetical protein